MKHEIFKTIPEYPRYEVSNYGRVRNRVTGKYIKQRISANYYEVQFTINRKNHHAFVHRLVAYTFMDNPDPEVLNIVNHIDENPTNNRLDNLEFCDREWNATWGTVIDRVRSTKKAKGQFTSVYVIRKSDQSVFKFSTIREASDFTGVVTTTIRKALKDWRTKIEGDYVFCISTSYTKNFAIKLVNNSLGYHYKKYNGIYAVNVKTRDSLYFSSLKSLARTLHISDRKVATLIEDPKLKNPYDYVFCTKSTYTESYVDYLIDLYTYDAGQSIPIVGMNIKTNEIKHFKSIKQAEHILDNQSVGPYMLGKVKSAKDWVFCKEYEYSLDLLKDKAREANPNELPTVIVLDLKEGNYIELTTPISYLAETYGVSITTIRNQLTKNALSVTGQQFIYKSNFNDKVKNFYMDAYKKKTRGKAVYGIDINTLEITKYDSATEASNKLGISRDRILATIHRDSNQTNGYAFCYETYYSKLVMYKLAYEGKYGKDGYPVTSVSKEGKQEFYPSVKDASDKTGVTRNDIHRVIRGRGKTAGGYHWFKQDKDAYIKSLLDSSD